MMNPATNPASGRGSSTSTGPARERADAAPGGGSTAAGGAPSPQSAAQEGPFLPLEGGIRTLDQHIHAGLERTPPLADLLAFLARDGRRHVGLLDHSFLFDYDAAKLAEFRARGNIPESYPPGRAGMAAFFDDVSRWKESPPVPDMTVLQGLEVYERDVPEGGLAKLPAEVLERLDFIGYEFKVDAMEETPEEAGRKLAFAAQEAKRLYEASGVPAFLCHPFRATLSPLRKAGRGHDPSLSGRGVFPEAAMDAWIAAIDPSCCLVEINYRELAGQLREYPLFAEMTRATVQQLKAAGTLFSFGSDLHPKGAFQIPEGRLESYDPQWLLDLLGLSPSDFRRIRRRVGPPAP